MNNVTQPHVPTSAKAKPTHELRLGAVKAAVWVNCTEEAMRHNVTFLRLYKDGDQWKSSDQFGRDDLLALAKLADHVHSWICGIGQTPGRTDQG